MGGLGFRYTNEDVVFSVKKHFCPLCGQKLKRIIRNKIVKKNSKDAYKYNFDFNHPGGPPIGDIKKAKFAWNEYKCNRCNKYFTIEQLQNIDSNEILDSESEKNPINHKKGLICFFLIVFLLCLCIVIIRSIFC